MGLTAQGSDAVKSDMENFRTQIVDEEIESAKQVLAGSRSDVDGALLEALSTNGTRSTPFIRRKRFKFADSGAPSLLVDFTQAANKPKPLPYGESQQPASEVLGIQGFSIEFPSDMKLNTYKVAQKLGLRVVRADGEVGMEMPLSEVMDTSLLIADAGNNAGVAVAGTHHAIKQLRTVGLPGRQGLAIIPGDSSSGIEFFRLPEYSASDVVLTGETADLYMDIIWKGVRVAKAKGQS